MKAFHYRILKYIFWVGFVTMMLMTGAVFHNFYLRNIGQIKMIPSTLSFLSSPEGIQTRVLQWDNSSAAVQTEPKTKVGFLKVHKAASTTTQSIFLRFGWRNNLTFVLPPEYNVFQYPNIISVNESVTQYNTLPTPPGKDFDILCHHVVFDDIAWRKLLPKDTAIVGTVREPISLFNSILNYFNPRNINKINAENPIGEFLKDPNRYEANNPRYSFTNNRMSFEYGLDAKIIKSRDTNLFDRYLFEVLDKVFDVVIVAERYDESLVLMKRKLNWSLNDILYAKKNVRSVPKSDRYNIKDADVPRLQRYLRFDVMLYEFFYKRLDFQIKAEGPSFQNEVKQFQDVRLYVETFCHSAPKPIRSVTVEKSEWNERFDITRDDCAVLHKQEITFTQEIRLRQYGEATWKWRSS